MKIINNKYFLEKMKDVFKYLKIENQYEEFINTLSLQPLHTIKINKNTPLQTITEYFGDNLYLENGICYLKEKPNFNNVELYKNGSIYPQEASSIVWGSVFDKVFETIRNPKVVVDLCAAPGGKSLSILNKISDTILISNEVDGHRSNALVENISKWKTNNVIVTQSKPKKLGRLSQFADIVCVDAPCSGEGMIRKLEKPRPFWNSYGKSLIKKCHNRQIEIIKEVSPLIKEGGYLLYSTCTYNLDENEKVIDLVCEKFGYEVITLDFLDLPKNVMITPDGFLRFFPHKFNGEGLFISLLKKTHHFEHDSEYVSLWKKQRIKNNKLIIETKNSIISKLEEGGVDLENNYVVKEDIRSEKPTILYLVNKNIFETLEHLNNSDYKLKYFGERIAKHGKNIEKSLKILT